MKELRTKLKRQLEILGIVLCNPYQYKITYFEELFNVNSLTIKRDLHELRNLGISIHSIKGKGINVSSKIDDNLIKELVIHYIGITSNQSSYDKATSLFVSKLHSTSISIITILHKSIETSHKVKIEYEKPGVMTSEERIIEPCCIFQSDKNWRLLAKNQGKLKQFVLNRIKSIYQLNKTFKRTSQKQVEEIFSTSFKSWLGNERYNVKLKFLTRWSNSIKPSQLMESQKIIEDEDGTIVYETVVNSLKEIAGWIVSRGDGVVVLEPEELKKLVIKTAKGVLKNYN